MKKIGGYRPGSGRPYGTGKYKETTHPVRIPESLMPKVLEMLERHLERVSGINVCGVRNIYKLSKDCSGVQYYPKMKVS